MKYTLPTANEDHIKSTAVDNNPSHYWNYCQINFLSSHKWNYCLLNIYTSILKSLALIPILVVTIYSINQVVFDVVLNHKGGSYLVSLYLKHFKSMRNWKMFYLRNCALMARF